MCGSCSTIDAKQSVGTFISFQAIALQAPTCSISNDDRFSKITITSTFETTAKIFTSIVWRQGQEFFCTDRKKLCQTHSGITRGLSRGAKRS